MIIFVGEELRGGFVSEVINKNGDEVKFVNISTGLKDYEHEINLLARNGCDAIIYDIDNIYDEPQDLMAVIMSIRETTRAKVILYSPTINPNNTIITEAVTRGLKNFIDSSTTMTEQKNQLTRCLSDLYERKEHPSIVKIKEKQKEKKLRESSYRTIGIVGTIHRIGTTTQCLQVVRYLNSKGFRACYVEMNSNRYKNIINNKGKDELSYVEKVPLFYSVTDKDEELGFYQCDGIDMYYKADKLPEILDKEYDYYVYDYGTYTDIDFNKASYLKDNLNIFVCGTGITEIDMNADVISNPSYIKSKLVFNFLAEEEIPDFLNSLGDKISHRAYFTKYTTDPFKVTDLVLYDNLLSSIMMEMKKPEEKNEKQVKEKKTKGFRFFRRTDK